MNRNVLYACIAILFVMILAACATDPALSKGKPPPKPTPPPTQVCWDGTVIPATSTCPPRPPVTTDPQPTAVLPPPIASNFDVAAELAAAPIPGREEGGEGAFRFIGEAGKLSYDDPIVYPGQPGKSHLHQYFCNDSVDANSTYASLRMAGESTCNNKLNRSGYWISAMLDGKGNAVRPDYVSIYYKRPPSTAPRCAPGSATRQGICVKLPRGLKYIFGFDMINMVGPADPNSMWFNCDGPGAVGGHYKSITEAIPNCPMGTKLGAVIFAPSCWNGRDLDSADHRSHMAYASYGDWGYLKCPDTHPFLIPQFTLGAWWTVDENLPTWHLSSDVHADGQMMTPGTTLHSDWEGAWDDQILDAWQANCIEKQLSCSSGNLGNGTMMKIHTPSGGYSYVSNPRLVPVPPRP